ncbi:zinc finger and SCAN domain-containing protein 2-like [Dunckerocampus dactyliophorus]|uniref:zinc finger and SCAN domain-containing protein 2-like n=1 Tax=Dunckerocampus dactyliophorus TaxID=161453 RepID=UPI002406CDCB|nr:zinc finger and SCAN domain-containing protein 2-like [Dunckerocampus dactyliophorus]
MCKVQMLRALVNQRLTVAVEEIFQVLERTIAEYEEELSRIKEDNERQRQLLDFVFKKSQVVLHRADVSEEHLSPEQQEWSFRMKQEEPQLLHVKEEEEDHSISQEGEHLEGLEEFAVICVPVKSEDVEDKGQSEEEREVEPPSGSPTQHMTTEADGDHCGGSQAGCLFAPLSDSDDTRSHSADTDDEDSKADMTCNTDNTLFKCSQCEKTFNEGCNLKRHMRTHTGEKPYVCSVCGKRYSQKGNLTIHTRTHTGEKPFSCSKCGIGFVRSQHLTMHMKIHTGEKPFTCSVCGLGLRRNQDLKKHMRIHTGEKPFTCFVCGISFVRKQDLKRHTRIHTGEKPFTCSVCGIGFSRNYYLKTHMRRHTMERNHFLV